MNIFENLPKPESDWLVFLSWNKCSIALAQTPNIINYVPRYNRYYLALGMVRQSAFLCLSIPFQHDQGAAKKKVSISFRFAAGVRRTSEIAPHQE